MERRVRAVPIPPVHTRQYGGLARCRQAGTTAFTLARCGVQAGSLQQVVQPAAGSIACSRYSSLQAACSRYYSLHTSPLQASRYYSLHTVPLQAACSS